MKKSMLKLILVLLLSIVANAAIGNTIYPDTVLQRKMQEEETLFLKKMQPGLQHSQMLAVRVAIAGDDADLQAIRKGRNRAPELPEEVSAFYPSEDICIFIPNRPSSAQRPILLYLHGGGWCFGSINSCARFCAAVALEADCAVAALNYRLSPAYPFPAPLEDCEHAVSFLRQHAAEWGCDSSKVSVGGDSAGGNLALATALFVDGISSVIPIYPVTKLFDDQSVSWSRYAEGYGNDAELLLAFYEAYAAHDAYSPQVSMGLVSDDMLSKLPPALFISAGHDVLLDQTAEMVARLEALGKSVTYHVYPTATHLFITVPGQPTAFREAVKAVGRAMKF